MVAEQEAHHHDDHHHADEPHESPITMTLPLMVLALPSIAIGLLGMPFNNRFEAFIYAPGEANAALEAAAEFEWSEFLLMAGNSVGIALIGITLASLMYRTRKVDPAAIANRFPSLYEFSLNKWFMMTSMSAPSSRAVDGLLVRF